MDIHTEAPSKFLTGPAVLQTSHYLFTQYSKTIVFLFTCITTLSLLSKHLYFLLSFYLMALNVLFCLKKKKKAPERRVFLEMPLCFIWNIYVIHVAVQGVHLFLEDLLFLGFFFFYLDLHIQYLSERLLFRRGSSKLSFLLPPCSRVVQRAQED